MTPSDEDSFEQIALVELTLEKSRAKAERAVESLRELGAEPHLVEAVNHTREELSALTRRLRQSTYFAVPDSQERLERS